MANLPERLEVAQLLQHLLLFLEKEVVERPLLAQCVAFVGDHRRGVVVSAAASGRCVDLHVPYPPRACGAR